MIRLIVLLLNLTLLGLAVTWLANHPGNVTIHWLDRRIDTTPAILVAAFILFALLVTVLWRIIHAVLIAPGQWRQRHQLRQYERGIKELTYSVAALAASDTKNALTHTKRAEKQLGKTPLITMLKAQAARSAGDDAKAQYLLEELLGHEETHYLAARSLSEVANRQQQYERALTLAKHAFDAGPKDNDSVTSVVSLHIRNEQWQQALHAINNAPWRSYENRTARRRHLGLVHLAYAQKLLADNRGEEAIYQAKQATGYLGDFIPAYISAAKAYALANDTKGAEHALKKAWKIDRHPEVLAEMRALIRNLPAQEEEAKLSSFLNDKRHVSGSQWFCHHCGHTQHHWETFCPTCHNFDSFEWR